MIWEYPISRNTQISANENHFYYLALIYYHSYLLQYYTETIYIYISLVLVQGRKIWIAKIASIPPDFSVDQ